MSHEKNEKRYYSFYLITFGVLMGLCFAGNLVTLYLFYEFMTLASMPLVIHNGSKEAVMAALKYLFYSFCGAYMALFGIYFLYRYAIVFENPGDALGGTYYYETAHMMGFVPGGSLDMAAVVESGNTTLCLVAVFDACRLWREGRVLSAPRVATDGAPCRARARIGISFGHYREGGILAIIRTVYYCVGTDFLRGTWVQTVWGILAVITLLMGSSLAFKEKILKKGLRTRPYRTFHIFCLGFL